MNVEVGKSKGMMPAQGQGGTRDQRSMGAELVLPLEADF